MDQRVPEHLDADADQRSQLAADRTVLAAERSYAAWIRTGLASLASAIGAKALLSRVIPEWLALAASTILILFSAFCFSAAIWRELFPGARPPPNMRRIPKPVLYTVNGILILLDLATLAGIWLVSLHLSD